MDCLKGNPSTNKPIKRVFKDHLQQPIFSVNANAKEIGVRQVASNPAKVPTNRRNSVGSPLINIDLTHDSQPIGDVVKKLKYDDEVIGYFVVNNVLVYPVQMALYSYI